MLEIETDPVASVQLVEEPLWSNLPSVSSVKLHVAVSPGRIARAVGLPGLILVRPVLAPEFLVEITKLPVINAALEIVVVDFLDSVGHDAGEFIT